MKYLHNVFLANSAAQLRGLEEIIVAVVSGYPNEDVCADIRSDGKSYSFEPMKSPPSSPRDNSSLNANHVGYLFSKHLKSTFDVDFERCLQPSLSDLRSMYESGDALRAFVATNGVGWAFRLLDFQDVSLAEFDWLDFGFIKTMCSKENVEYFMHCMPKRMALALLRQDERMVRLLVDESRIIGARIDRLQVLYGPIPSELLARFLLVGTSAIIVGEAFLQGGESQSDGVFERHLVEAFNAVKRGDSKSAFDEVMKFSISSVHALAGPESGEAKLRKIREVNSRLHELRLPSVPESRKFIALVGFLEDVHECAYSILLRGYGKIRSRLKQRVELDGLQMLSEDQYSLHQAVSKEQQVFDGVREFMVEAIENYPNIVVGRIRTDAEGSNQYLITDFRVLPCDVTIRYSVAVGARDGLVGVQGSRSSVGRAVSKLCHCEHEMLPLLHPDTRTLNEMLRSGYGLNAIAVTNGEKCLLRIHDGSNNTVASAHTA